MPRMMIDVRMPAVSRFTPRPAGCSRAYVGAALGPSVIPAATSCGAERRRRHLLERRGGFFRETDDRAHPQGVRIGKERSLTRRPAPHEQRLQRQWQGDVGHRPEPTRRHALEAPRRHPDNSRRDAIDGHGLIQRRYGAGEHALPEVITDDRGQRRIRSIVRRRQAASDCHWLTHHIEEGTVRQNARRPFSRPAGDHDVGARNERKGAQQHTRSFKLLQLLVGGKADVAAHLLAGRRVEPVVRVHSREAVDARSPEDEGQFLRALDRQRVEQRRASDADDGGVGTDTQSERQHGDQRERRTRDEPSDDVANVCEQSVGGHGSNALTRGAGPGLDECGAFLNIASRHESAWRNEASGELTPPAFRRPVKITSGVAGGCRNPTGTGIRR